MPIDERFLDRWLPELKHFQRQDDRKKVIRKARNDVLRSPCYWTFVVAVTVGAIMIRLTVERDLLLPKMLSAVLCGLFLGIIGSIGGLWLFKGRIRLSIRAALAQKGKRVCTRCGYCCEDTDRTRCCRCDAELDDRHL